MGETRQVVIDDALPPYQTVNQSKFIDAWERS
jgi:hypothetical protein